MNPKPNYAPFSFTSAPLFGASAPNPFAPAPVADDSSIAARAVDAVWCQDAGDGDDTDVPAPEAIDVRVLWGTNVLHFEQMCPPRSFVLGGVGSDFTLPAVASAASMESCPLVLVGSGAESATASVFVAAGANAEVKLINGSTLSLAQCTEKGLATTSTTHVGAHEIVLPHGATATLQFVDSDLVFEVSRARARQQPEIGFFAGADLSGQIYTGLSALAHATIVGALAFFLPAMHSEDADAIDRNSAAAMMPYLEAIAEREPDPPEAVSEAGVTAPSGGGGGSQAVGPSGTMGATVSHASNAGRYGIQGDAREAQLARSHEIEQAATFGMLNILSGDPSNTPIAAWGENSALGHDAKSAMGGMFGQTIDDALGAGGLGLSGSEEGGGGFAHGVGIDGIGSTVGHGSGNWPGDGPGRGPGHDFGPPGFGLSHDGNHGGHVAVAPKVRESPLTTFNGSLPREIVQRVVRQNFGRFRLCYEGGLRGNPGLTGRVAVAFVIDRNGGVAVASADRSTDMADPNVVACVVRGFQNLSFPAPANGTVQVIYPLMLAPGE